MNVQAIWSALSPLLGIGAIVTFLGAMGTFVVLASRIAELNRDGDRRLPRFRGNLFFLWPPVLFDWLGTVVDRCRGVDQLRTDFMLARACRTFFAGFYLLWATAAAAHVYVIANQ